MKTPTYLEAFQCMREFLEMYYSNTKKNQPEVFNIDQEDIGLADIEPERDLL